MIVLNITIIVDQVHQQHYQQSIPRALRSKLPELENRRTSGLPVQVQTWNLSKNLHHRIFGLKILHHKFHLISTALVGKKTQKMSENGEIYTTGKNFTLPLAVTAVTNLTSV